MADQNIEYRTVEHRKSSSGALAFVVGGLVVLVGVLAYVIFGTGYEATSSGGTPSSIEINTNADSAAGAEAADDASTGAAASDAQSGGSSADAAAGAAATDGN